MQWLSVSFLFFELSGALGAVDFFSFLAGASQYPFRYLADYTDKCAGIQSTMGVTVE